MSLRATLDPPTRVFLRSPRPGADEAFRALAVELAKELPVPVDVIPGEAGARQGFPRNFAEGAALIGGGQAVVRETLEAHDNWQWFHLMSSGVDDVREWTAPASLCLATHSRGVNARSMAEWVLAAILHFQRDLDLYTRAQWDPGAQEQRWERRWARELAGRHVVVLGAGSVAGELGPMAGALGLRTTGISRSGKPVPGLDAVRDTSALEELLPTADVLVVLLPLTAQTEGLVSAELLARLPEGSLLVAASRGGVVDEAAALRGVREGRLRGAAFDVFEQEPLASDAPHWREPGVLVTPHVAGTTDRFMERTARIVLELWEAAFSEPGDPALVEQFRVRGFGSSTEGPDSASL